jgi:hypothetical protein
MISARPPPARNHRELLVSLLDTDNEHGLVTEVYWPVLFTGGER